MAKISNLIAYPTVIPTLGDYVIGTDISDSNATVNYSFASIADILPNPNLEEVLAEGNTATNNIILTGNISISGTYGDTSGDVGTAGQVLSSTGTGTDWVDNVDGSGTLNTIAKWTPDGNTLGDSHITDNGSTINITSSASYFEVRASGGSEFQTKTLFSALATTDNILHIADGLHDNANNPGGSGQILSSTTTGVQWIDQLPSGLEYMGVWDAFSNLPPLASGVGTPGQYYIVGKPGTTNLDGNNSWQNGDWAVFSSTNVWQEIDNQNIFSGSGTANTMTKFTGTLSLGDSQSTDDGTNINITPTGQLDLGGSPIEISSAINEVNVNSKIDLLNKVNLIGTTECTGPFVDAFVSQGNVGQVLSSTGAGQVQWIDGSAAAGALSGGGTLNYIPKWTPSGTELGNSVLFDDGTDLTTPIPVAGEIKLLAHNHWYLESKGDVNIEAEGEIDINNLGSAITDRIRISTHDALGYDQYIDLWNNNTGLDIDVNLLTIDTTTDLVLNSGAALKLHTTGAGYLAGANFVFQNDSVEFTKPIIDSVGSIGVGGDILKNDGTGKIGWSAPGWSNTGGLFEASVTVTAAELLNIAVAHKIIIPALGANLVIQVVAMNINKAAGVAYDFPENLYAVERNLLGNANGKQVILDTAWTNAISSENITCNAVASGSFVDGAPRYGLKLSLGNENLILTQDGVNATVGTGDLTLVIYYRKLDVTTMEFLPS